MLPQIVTLIIVGFFVEKFVDRVGIHNAAWFGSLSVVAGIVIYAAVGQVAYVFVAIPLVLIAAGLRIVGVVSGVNVMKGTPKNRTSVGAALVDTTDEIASGVSIAIVGTLVAALFVGDFSQGHWTTAQSTQFHSAASLSSWILAVAATALIVWAYFRARNGEKALPG